MKDESTGIMEDQIIAEETLPKGDSPKQQNQGLQKAKKPRETLREWFYKLKAPKPITYIILCSLVIVIYTSLLLLSQKQASTSPKPSPKATSSPQAAPSTEPQMEDIIKEVADYNTNIDTLNSKPRKFEPPNVDLDINFSDKK